MSCYLTSHAFRMKASWTGYLGLFAPGPLLGCGGCVDGVLMTTLPWAGFGVLFLWAWVVTMLVARAVVRRRDALGTNTLVRPATLTIFAVFGSAGYVALVLAIGSLLYPSLIVGLLWSVYVIIRFSADLVRFAHRRRNEMRIPLLIHGIFLLVVLAVVVSLQAGANSLEHYIACLRYSRHTVLYARVMPGIVAHGTDAVHPLIQATHSYSECDHTNAHMNTVVNATFCLARIGGRESEAYLSTVVAQNSEPHDYVSHRLCKAACFAYARCAGPRATKDLVTVYQRMSAAKDPNDSWIPLLALLVTGSEEGVNFVLDHLELLITQMEDGGDDNETHVLQAALGCLVFGSDPSALTRIPLYRDCRLSGATWLAESRPNDYNSDFFWTASSEASLHTRQEIVSEWRRDCASIRKRWTGLLIKKRGEAGTSGSPASSGTSPE